MLIKWIQLENIRSYLNARIDFPSSTVLLSGDIGSGKSSILYALEFVFFGIKRGELSGASLLRTGTKLGSVEACIDVDGKEVIVKRALRRTKTGIIQDSGYIIQDGVKTEYTAQELKSAVFSLFGYPLSHLSKSKDMIFRYTVYTPQEMMKQIISDDKELRLDTLRRVFGIEKYRTIKENIQSYTKELRFAINGLKGSLVDYDSKKQRFSEHKLKFGMLTESLKKIDAEIARIDSQMEESGKVLHQKKNTYEDFLKKKQLLDNQKLKSEELGKQQQTLDQEIMRSNESLTQIQSKEKELSASIKHIPYSKDEIEKRISDAQKLINDTLSEGKLLEQKQKDNNALIDSISVELKSARDKLVDLPKLKERMLSLRQHIAEKDQVKQSIAELEKQIELSNTEINGFSTRKKMSEELMAKIDSLSRCPTCMQDVPLSYKADIKSTEQKKIALVDNNINELQKKVNEFKQQLADAQHKWETIIDSDKEFGQVKTQITMLLELQVQLSEKQKRYDQLLQEQKAIELKLAKPIDTAKMQEQIDSDKQVFNQIIENNKRKILLEQFRLQHAEKKETLDRYTQSSKQNQEALNALKESLIVLQKEVDLNREVPLELELAQKSFDMIKDTRANALIEQASVKKELEGYQREIALLQEEIVKMDKSRKKIRQFISLKAYLDDFIQNLIVTIEKHVMLCIHREFDVLFSQWFNLLVEDENLVAQLDDCFSPSVVQNGHDLEINYLSGGERTAIALAYRLALNKVISSLIRTIATRDMMILDEPTDGFSEQQLDRMREVIEQLDCSQIIIVSHDPKIETFVDNIIKIEKYDHISTITNQEA